MSFTALFEASLPGYRAGVSRRGRHGPAPRIKVRCQGRRMSLASCRAAWVRHSCTVCPPWSSPRLEWQYCKGGPMPGQRGSKRQEKKLNPESKPPSMHGAGTIQGPPPTASSLRRLSNANATVNSNQAFPAKASHGMPHMGVKRGRGRPATETGRVAGSVGKIEPRGTIKRPGARFARLPVAAGPPRGARATWL